MSILRSSQPEEPTDSPDLRRREISLGGLALLTLGSAACSKKKPVAPPRKTQQIQAAFQEELAKAQEARRKQAPKEPEVPTVIIPKFEFIDEPVNHPVPEGLNMDREGFQEFSQVLGENLVRGVQALNEFVKNAPEEASKQIQGFIGSFAEFLSKANLDTKK